MESTCTYLYQIIYIPVLIEKVIKGKKSLKNEKDHEDSYYSQKRKKFIDEMEMLS